MSSHVSNILLAAAEYTGTKMAQTRFSVCFLVRISWLLGRLGWVQPSQYRTHSLRRRLQLPAVHIAAHPQNPQHFYFLIFMPPLCPTHAMPDTLDRQHIMSHSSLCRSACKFLCLLFLLCMQAMSCEWQVKNDGAASLWAIVTIAHNATYQTICCTVQLRSTAVSPTFAVGNGFKTWKAQTTLTWLNFHSLGLQGFSKAEAVGTVSGTSGPALASLCQRACIANLPRRKSASRWSGPKRWGLRVVIDLR